MNFYLLVFVSLAYAGTGITYFLKGQPAWGVFWLGYAASNCAFLVATEAYFSR